MAAWTVIGGGGDYGDAAGTNLSVLSSKVFTDCMAPLLLASRLLLASFALSVCDTGARLAEHMTLVGQGPKQQWPQQRWWWWQDGGDSGGGTGAPLPTDLVMVHFAALDEAALAEAITAAVTGVMVFCAHCYAGWQLHRCLLADVGKTLQHPAPRVGVNVAPPPLFDSERSAHIYDAFMIASMASACLGGPPLCGLCLAYGGTLVGVAQQGQGRQLTVAETAAMHNSSDIYSSLR
jgi:hypothetical protein